MTDPVGESKALFRIPECNWSGLQNQLARLAKRAEKLGLTPPRLEVQSTEDVPLRDMSGVPGYSERTLYEEGQIRAEHRSIGRVVGSRRYFRAELLGEAPTLPGWTLVAVIEHGHSELGNVIRGVPGEECPKEYRQADALCEHCHTVRRRLETFLLRKTEGKALGTLRQIGRSCLADYLRSPDAAAKLAEYAQLIASARGLAACSEGGGRGISRVGVERALALTARLIRHCGWLSRSQAKELAEQGDYRTPTANIVSAALFTPQNFFRRDFDTPNEIRALQDAARDVQEEDIQLAHASLAWIRDMRPQAESLTDYLHNALIVASEETVEDKHLGILCSVVSAYKRSLERKHEATVRELSRHFGEPKKRGRWKATFLAKREFEGEVYGYGNEPTVRYMYRMAVDGRDIAVWFTGTVLDLTPGEEIYVVGSVKKHEEYQGTAQTVLTRCNVYTATQVGHCPNCSAVVLPNDRRKNCPSCRKRGLKVEDSWFKEDK